GARACDRRDYGHPNRFKAGHDLAAVCLVLESILQGRKLAKLRDVGSGSKRVARSSQNERTDRRVLIDPGAFVDQPVVHRPGQRVSRLRTVEGQPLDRATLLAEQLSAGELRHRRFAGCGSATTPVLSSSSTCA